MSGSESNLNPLLDASLRWDVGSTESNIVRFGSPIYNGDGTLASATIDGSNYSFTYSNGKLSTVTVGGITKTYTWSGDQLQSVVVS